MLKSPNDPATPEGNSKTTKVVRSKKVQRNSKTSKNVATRTATGDQGIVRSTSHKKISASYAASQGKAAPISGFANELKPKSYARRSIGGNSQSKRQLVKRAGSVSMKKLEAPTQRDFSTLELAQR